MHINGQEMTVARVTEKLFEGALKLLKLLLSLLLAALALICMPLILWGHVLNLVEIRATATLVPRYLFLAQQAQFLLQRVRILIGFV
jgi:hypothetical protein